jgi:protein-S-isoprenylcysteine O-methyltransferase Ste14
MSTANETTAVPYAHTQSSGLIRKWMARRRIAISITCFTALVFFNLVVLRRHPGNPLALGQWNSGFGVALIVFGLAIRSWSAGTLNKFRELVTTGPYALSRNPLYVGSFLMMYGFALIMSDWLSIAFIAGPMTVLYYFQVLNEEKYLANAFPNQWTSYIKQTSRFVPLKFNSNWRSGWSVAQWRCNREYQAIYGAAVGILGLIVLNRLGW